MESDRERAERMVRECRVYEKSPIGSPSGDVVEELAKEFAALRTELAHTSPEPAEPSTPLPDAELLAHEILGPREGVLCNDDQVWKWMHTRIPAEVFKEIIARITRAIRAARSEAPAAPADQKFLRTLVDAVWGHCYENGSVPATEVADKLIAKARVWAAAPKEGK